MRATRVVILAAMAALLGSCGGELTEILVVVDSDLAVPSALDGLRVEVSGAEAMTAEGSLRAGASGLPRTVGVVHRGGSLGPLTIRAVGTLGGVDVVSARAVTSFLRGRTLVLPLFLSRACASVSCGNDETCSGGACVSAAVDPEALEEWNGSVGRLDGGTPCEPVSERCNGADDDCDGMTDEGFDLDTDPLNCGACFNVCSTNNATPACAGGVCSIAACAAGFADCDGVAGSGCEANLGTSIFHCGACDAACSVANATAVCADGECGVGACDAAFDDCNADEADGCEASLETATDCGACGVACTVAGGTGSCAGGTCAVGTCDAGLGDCNADASDGCEQPLDTLDDCGTCGAACALANATSTCATGTCEIEACDAGFADCDGSPANGCEAALNTLTDCGACGVSCALPNGTETCASGTCEVDTCDTGRGNCDSDASNGCETDTTRNDAHCGMCGNACPPGDMCRMSVCR